MVKKEGFGMNLTKQLKWALACAGALALTASAGNIIEDTFESYYHGDGMVWLYPNWIVVNPSSQDKNDSSQILDVGDSIQWPETFDASRLGYKGQTPLGAPDTKVLALNTEGDTLSRVLDPMETGYSEEAPLYIDMMVKFVLSEDSPDLDNDEDVKFAVWADAESNLCVWAASDHLSTREAYVLDNAKVDPEAWHRLTIRCSAFEGVYAYFEVKLDGGSYLTSIGGWWEDQITQGGGSRFYSADFAFWDCWLTSIDFQGTGFIDELVVTTDDPDFGSETLFGNKYPVDPVAYAAWHTLFGSGAGSETLTMYSAFLMNVDPDDGTTEARLHIDKIDVDGVDANITLKAVDGKGVMGLLPTMANGGRAINGTLYVATSADLVAWSSWAKVAVPDNGVVAIPMDSADRKFIRAKIE